MTANELLKLARELLSRSATYQEKHDAIRAIDKFLAEPADRAASVPPDAESTQPVAWRDVLAERQRQISAEGWTLEHDDEHDDGALAMAAGCYALKAGGSCMALGHFPWGHGAWKPGPTPRHCLIKAGALILAEIERLDRLTDRGPICSDCGARIGAPHNYGCMHSELDT